MNSLIITTPEDLEALIAKVLDNHLKTAIPAPAATPNEIISGDTLCQRLDITEPTLFAHRKRGLIPFLRIGSCIRYDYSKVLQALENKKTKA